MPERRRALGIRDQWECRRCHTYGNDRPDDTWHEGRSGEVKVDQLQRSSGGRRTDTSQPAERRERRLVLVAAPRLAIGVIPKWVLRMSRAGRPRRIPEEIVRGLLKTIDDRAIERALCVRETVSTSQPPPGELRIVGDEAEHLRACALPERGKSVLQEEADDTVWVEHVVRHGVLPSDAAARRKRSARRAAHQYAVPSAIQPLGRNDFRRSRACHGSDSSRRER
jgi:hypothetical protein